MPPAETTEPPRPSPGARRLAEEHGIDLGAVDGSGPRGRIVRADVEALIERAGSPATGPKPDVEPRRDVEAVALTKTQRTIARRMVEAKSTIPEFVLTSRVDMQGCTALRAELKAAGGPVPSYNDMVVRACALALREHPRANGSYRDDRFELHPRVNIGVAVAARDALLVPTVFDADRRSLGEIAAETRRLAERVRSGAITPPELSDGTFTVSNLGMYGVTSFQAVINPPQAAILAVGAIKQRAVEAAGHLALRPAMDLTLTCDHRILYGADGAAFLARICELLERPAQILL